MIEKHEIEKLAHLSRLTLSDNEVETLQKDLSSILDYVSELGELDLTHMEPTTHAEPLYNVMREDAVHTAAEDVRRNVLDALPNVEKGYLKVKNVFHNE